eukprot:g6537.t1
MTPAVLSVLAAALTVARASPAASPPRAGLSPSVLLFDNAQRGAPLMHMPPPAAISLRAEDLHEVLARILRVPSPVAPAAERRLPAADAFREPATNLLVLVGGQEASADATAVAAAAALNRAAARAAAFAIEGAAVGARGSSEDEQQRERDAFAWLPRAVVRARGRGDAICAAVHREACEHAGADAVFWDGASRAFRYRRATGAGVSATDVELQGELWLSLAQALGSGEGGAGVPAEGEGEADASTSTVERALLRSLHRLPRLQRGPAAPAPPSLLTVHVRSAAGAAEVGALCAGMAAAVPGALAGQVVTQASALPAPHAGVAAGRRLAAAAAPASAADPPRRRLADQGYHPQTPQYATAYSTTPTTRYWDPACVAARAQGGMAYAMAGCPPSSSDIAGYQVALWTAVGLGTAVLAAACALVNMDVGKDPLLYARFSVDSGAP